MATTERVGLTTWWGRSIGAVVVDTDPDKEVMKNASATRARRVYS